MTEVRKSCCAPCEAPEHAEECNGRGETTDHFTPKCIARIMGWTRSRVNMPDNLQYLSRACHNQKDRDTAKRRELLLYQLEGGTLKFGDHL